MLEVIKKIFERHRVAYVASLFSIVVGSFTIYSIVVKNNSGSDLPKDPPTIQPNAAVEPVERGPNHGTANGSSVKGEPLEEPTGSFGTVVTEPTPEPPSTLGRLSTQELAEPAEPVKLFEKQSHLFCRNVTVTIDEVYRKADGRADNEAMVSWSGNARGKDDIEVGTLLPLSESCGIRLSRTDQKNRGRYAELVEERF